MDILRLNKTTFAPDALIELDVEGSKKSGVKIWSERYAPEGDFEFRTHRVEEVQELIPEGSLVSLRETDEIMIVDTHEIANDGEGIPQLVIKGRSFETFLENRITQGLKYQEPWPMKIPYTTEDALMCYLWQCLVNVGSLDVTRQYVWANNVNDSIPNVRISDSSSFTEAVTVWWLQAGVVYTTVKDFLSLGTLGIRNIRPTSHNAYIISVGAGGTITKTLTTNIAQLRVDVYNGTNRTENQSVVTPVIFNYDQGHIVDPKYLDSIRDYANHVSIISSTGVSHAYESDDDTRSGLDRRSAIIDGGTKDSGISTASWLVQQKKNAKAELKRRRRTHLLDGAVNPFSPYVYNQDYFLGDKVTVMGERGYKQTMMVEEYVRTEDRTGETGVPTLAVPVI